MSIGLDHFDMSRWARSGLGFPVRYERALIRWGGPLAFFLPVVLMVGVAGAWLVLPASDSDGADGDPVEQVTPAVLQPSMVQDDAGAVQSNPAVPSVSTGQQPVAISEPPPAAALRII